MTTTTTSQPGAGVAALPVPGSGAASSPSGSSAGAAAGAGAAVGTTADATAAATVTATAGAAPGVLRTFSGFPRPIWIIFAGTVVNRIGFLVSPFLVFFLGSRGVSASQTPYVLGALGAGNLVGPAVGGWLADRHSRRAAILTGLLGTAAAQGALFFAPNVATLAVAAAALSSAGMMVGPASFAILTDTVEAGRRQAAFALFGWAVNIGTAVAGVLGGYLAAHGYWLLFVLDAGASLVYAGIVVWLLPSDRAERLASAAATATATAAAVTATAVSADGSSTAIAATPPSSGYGVVFRDRLMRRLLPLLAVQLFIYSLTESALPLAIRTDGLPPTVLGLAAALNAGIVVALQPLATSVLGRFPRTSVYTASGILVTVGVALTGLAHSPAAYAATVVVWSLGEVASGGVAGAMIADLAPADARGRYQGAFSWAWGVARFLALTAGATVYTVVGPAALWIFVAAAGAGATAGVAALGPSVDRRTGSDS